MYAIGPYNLNDHRQSLRTLIGVSDDMMGLFTVLENVPYRRLSRVQHDCRATMLYRVPHLISLTYTHPPSLYSVLFSMSLYP